MDIISSLLNGRIVWEKVYPAVQNAVTSQVKCRFYPCIYHLKNFESDNLN